MLRLLLRVGRHTAIAFVVTSVLGAIGLQVASVGGFGGPPDRFPYILELRLSEQALTAEATTPLLDELGRTVTPAPTIELRPSGTWLVVRAATSEDRQIRNTAVAAVMSRHGFSRTTVRLTTTSQQLAALVRDPLGQMARYRSLVPLLVFFGGAGFAVVGWFFRRRDPQPAWETSRLGPGRGLLVGAAVGLVSVGIVEGLARVATWLGAPVEEQAWVLELAAGGGPALVALFVLGVAVAPLGEELFFRGHLFRTMAAGGFLPMAYVLSAGIFTMAHGNNPSGFPAYFAYGLALAWSYDRTRSIVVPVVAHAVVNGVTLGLLVVG